MNKETFGFERVQEAMRATQLLRVMQQQQQQIAAGTDAAAASKQAQRQQQQQAQQPQGAPRFFDNIETFYGGEDPWRRSWKIKTDERRNGGNLGRG